MIAQKFIDCFQKFVDEGKIVINGFSDRTDEDGKTDKDKILAAMQRAYVVSPTARNMFDRWFSANNANIISIKYRKGTALAHPNQGEVEIDLDYIDSLGFIDNNGTARQVTLDMVIVHELVHALTGRLDYSGNSGDSIVIERM